MAHKLKRSSTEAVDLENKAIDTVIDDATIVDRDVLAALKTLKSSVSGKANSSHTHTTSNITNFPTSLPANGGTSDMAKGLIGDDTRAINAPPSEYMNGGGRYLGRAGWQTEFKNIATMGVGAYFSGTYCYVETKNPWSDPSGGYPIQIVYGNGTPVWRVGVSRTAWSDWKPLSDGGNASTVGGFTVSVSVPSNAKFTDTVYTHPSTHPASMITESTTKRFVSDTEKSTWNNKSNFSGNYNDLTNKPTIPEGVVVNNTLTSTSTTQSLSANQGRILKGLVDKAQSDINNQLLIQSTEPTTQSTNSTWLQKI